MYIYIYIYTYIQREREREIMIMVMITNRTTNKQQTEHLYIKKSATGLWELRTFEGCFEVEIGRASGIRRPRFENVSI